MLSRSRGASHVTVNVFVQVTSEKACLCVFNQGTPDEQELWVPYSQVENIEAVDRDKKCDLSIARWLLDKNKITYE